LSFFYFLGSPLVIFGDWHESCALPDSGLAYFLHTATTLARNVPLGGASPMSMDLNQAPVQVQRASPQLVAANHILALSSAYLQMVINKEIIDNPALAMEETPVCPTCGRALQGNVCSNCVSATQPSQQVLDHDDYLDEAALWQFPNPSSGGDDEEFDP